MPGVLYTALGLGSVELFPFPKVHAHEVGDPVDLSVKLTVKGAQPDVTLEVKVATTAALTSLKENAVRTIKTHKMGVYFFAINFIIEMNERIYIKNIKKYSRRIGDSLKVMSDKL